MTTSKPRKRRPLTNEDVGACITDARHQLRAAYADIGMDSRTLNQRIGWAASALVQLCADLSIEIPDGVPATGAIALGGGHSQPTKGADDES